MEMSPEGCPGRFQSPGRIHLDSIVGENDDLRAGPTPARRRTPDLACDGRRVVPAMRNHSSRNRASNDQPRLSKTGRRARRSAADSAVLRMAAPIGRKGPALIPVVRRGYGLIPAWISASAQIL